MTGATLAPEHVPESLADRYRRADPAQRRAALGLLSVEQQRELATSRPWWWWGRSDQQEPAGDWWRWWLINAGRGWGKTRTGGEWTNDKAKRYPRMRGALIGPTIADVRDTMVEGESGILSFTDFTQLRGGSISTGWNRSLGELYYRNGSKLKGFSSETPMRLRGPQHHFVWGDEPAYWADRAAGTAQDTTFFNANVGLRLPARSGWPPYRPCGCLTTTPKLVPLLKVPEAVLKTKPEAAGLMQRADVVQTRGSTLANLHNLDQSYYDAVVAPLIGTSLGVQELQGILLDNVEGALWHTAQIEADRREAPAPDERLKTVVGFDPAGGEGLTHDEHGIVVACSSGTRDRLHAFILGDYSGNYAPLVAAQHAIVAAFEHQADAIVYEKNQGQDWIPTVFQQVWEALQADPEWAAVFGGWRMPTLEPVSAAKAKLQRATPVRNLSEQHRVHHTQTLAMLEAQMTTWVPGETDSPDRLDAMVWAVLWLYGMAATQGAVASPAGRERGGRRANQADSRMPAVYGYRGSRR